MAPASPERRDDQDAERQLWIETQILPDQDVDPHDARWIDRNRMSIQTCAACLPVTFSS